MIPTSLPKTALWIIRKALVKPIPRLEPGSPPQWRTPEVAAEMADKFNRRLLRRLRGAS